MISSLYPISSPSPPWTGRREPENSFIPADLLVQQNGSMGAIPAPDRIGSGGLVQIIASLFRFHKIKSVESLIPAGRVPVSLN